MGLEIPAGFCQMVINLSLGGDPEGMVSTWGLEIAAGIPTQSMANDLHDAGNGTIDKFCTDVYTFNNVTLLTQTLIVTSNTAGYSGFNAGDGLPQNCAALVAKKSGLRGQINQGRTYIPGLEESAVDDGGVIGGATLVVLDAALASWSTAVLATTDVTDLVILHTSVTDTLTPITSLFVEPVIATQRRRVRP